MWISLVHNFTLSKINLGCIKPMGCHLFSKLHLCVIEHNLPYQNKLLLLSYSAFQNGSSNSVPIPALQLNGSGTYYIWVQLSYFFAFLQCFPEWFFQQCSYTCPAAEWLWYLLHLGSAELFFCFLTVLSRMVLPTVFLSLPCS